jgi:hypothetical protein
MSVKGLRTGIQMKGESRRGTHEGIESGGKEKSGKCRRRRGMVFRYEEKRRYNHALALE